MAYIKDDLSSLISNYDTYELYTQSLAIKKENSCDLCYLYKIKTKSFANKIALLDHMISKHKVLIDTSLAHKYKIDDISKSIIYNSNILKVDFDNQYPDYITKLDSIDIKIEKYVKLVYSYFEFEFNKKKNIAEPGMLLPKDIDYKKYLTDDAIDEVIHIVDDFVKNISVKELLNLEPDAKYIPFDSFVREESILHLSEEVAIWYNCSKITDTRKSDVQFMIDLIKKFSKNIELKYPIFKSSFKELDDRYDDIIQLGIDNWHNGKHRIPTLPNGEKIQFNKIYNMFHKNAIRPFDKEEYEYIAKKARLGEHVHVEVHGSFATGLASMDSNLDLSLFVKDPNSQKWLIKEAFYILYELKQRLEIIEGLTATLVSESRTPSLRVTYKNLSFATIITIGTEDTPYQTLMLNHLVNVNSDFAPGIIFLKKWAKNNNLFVIDNSISYALTIMLQLHTFSLLGAKQAYVGVKKPDPSDLQLRLKIGQPYYPEVKYLDLRFGDWIQSFLNYYGGISLAGSDCFDYHRTAIAFGCSDAYSFVSKSLLNPESSEHPLVLIKGQMTYNLYSHFTNENLIKLRIAMRELSFKILYRSDRNQNLVL